MENELSYMYSGKHSGPVPFVHSTDMYYKDT